MCLSRLGQIIYGLVMFVALGLTLSGALTPGWRQLEIYMNSTLNNSTISPDSPEASMDQLKNTINAGLFSFLCTVPGQNSSAADVSSVEAARKYCEDWWKNQPTWEKMVVALVCATIVIEVTALVYNFVTLCCCCCRGHALKPLAPLALLGVFALGAAVTIFAVKNKDSLQDNKNFDDLDDPKNSVSYSFFLECGALVLLFIDTIVGSTSTFLGYKYL